LIKIEPIASLVTSKTMSYNPNQQGGYNPNQQSMSNFKQNYQPSYNPNGQQTQQNIQQQNYGQQQQSFNQYNQQIVQQQNPLVQWFNAVDSDRSGFIDVKELQAALSNGGFQFQTEAALSLIKMFDPQRNGKLDFKGFEQLYGYLTKMKGGFTQVDKDRSGTLDMNEVYQALGLAGFQIGNQSFQQIFVKFDRKKKGALDFDGYIEMCIFLGTMRNVFGYYDRNRQGVVSFNFDSFLQMSSMIYQ
jgi:Ca2+-binding EF-hand superfamily protein